jgi:hypothetical protein
MTTATAPLTWPTATDLDAAERALTDAFNVVEGIQYQLSRIVSAYMDEGRRPEMPATLETVGTLYSFSETLHSNVAALNDQFDEIRGDLREVDTMRLDQLAQATGHHRGEDAR